MSLKIYKPTSPGARGMTRLNYRELLSGHKPTKSLVGGYKRGVGRNNQGRITGRHHGGGERSVVLRQKMKGGDPFIVSETAPVKPGNRLPLGKLPVGTFVYNIEIKPGNGARLVRSAGNYAEVIAQDSGYTHLKMPSTEVRRIIGTAWASVGEVSNEEHRLVNIGKAGRTRWMGVRPTVRGTAMNPVDHP